MSGPLRPVPAWVDRTGLIQVDGSPLIVDPITYQRVIDRFHRYCWGFDERRLDILSDCFTEDATWVASSMGETTIGPFIGKRAVLEWLTRYWEVQRSQRRHVITNVVVSAVTSTTTCVAGYLSLYGTRHATSQLESVGVYELMCRTDGDVMRIATLTAGFDAPYWRGEVSDMPPETRRLFGILNDETSN